MRRRERCAITTAFLLLAVAPNLDGGPQTPPTLMAAPEAVSAPAPVYSALPRLERASRSVVRSTPKHYAHLSGPGAIAAPVKAKARSNPQPVPAPRHHAIPQSPAKATGATTAPQPSAAGWRSLGVRQITAYCTTGNQNAAGHWPQIGEVAVLDRSIPFGTHVRIAGLGTFVVEDWIGYGSEFDLYWGAGNCETRASNFGRQYRQVEIQR